MVNGTQFDGKILGQSRPTNTSAASIYSPDTAIKVANISGILIANVTALVATFRIFMDNDGTTFDETTAIFFDTPIAANSTILVEFDAKPLTLNSSSANVGVASGTASAITFTVYGEENAAN